MHVTRCADGRFAAPTSGVHPLRRYLNHSFQRLSGLRKRLLLLKKYRKPGVAAPAVTISVCHHDASTAKPPGAQSRTPMKGNG